MRVEVVEKEVEKIVYRDREVKVKDEQIVTNLQRAIARAEAAESKLAQAQYQEPEGAEEPPEELAGFFDGKPHGMAAKELLQEINDLANLIHLELATEDDREKHTILSRHAPYLRSKAVEVV